MKEIQLLHRKEFNAICVFVFIYELAPAPILKCSRVELWIEAEIFYYFNHVFPINSLLNSKL